MSLGDAIAYFTQLLDACFGAFRLEVWGIPIWILSASVILLAFAAAFLSHVLGQFLNSFGQSGGEKR